MENNLRAVIYARFSSHNQTEQSIEGQLLDCYSYAEKNNIQIIGEYIDRAISAKTDNRPNFQKMIKDSEKGVFDTILVWKLDRFSRNRYDSATYKAKLRRNGVRVVSCMECISNNAEGILIESLLEGMAEYYSAELAEKVNRGMRESALKCQSTGGTIPLGYKINSEKHFEIDEATAPVVHKIFELYADGIAPKDITDYLNKKGFKTSKGATFNKNSLRGMLVNRRYLGIYTYKDIEIEGGIPRIIEDDLFEKVQNMVKKNKHSGARHKAKADYILTTKLFCGKCKTMMVGESGSGRLGTTYHYYKCASRKKNPKSCDKATVSKDYIEKLVINNLYRVIFRDDMIEKIADKLMEFQNSEQSSGILESLQARMAEVDKSLNNVMRAIEEGIIAKTTQKRLKELEAEKEDIQLQIDKEIIANAKIERDSLVFMLKRYREGDVNDIEYQKRLINAFIYKIYVYDDRLLLIYNFTDNKKEMPEKEILQLSECSDISCTGSPHCCRRHIGLMRTATIPFAP